MNQTTVNRSSMQLAEASRKHNKIMGNFPGTYFSTFKSISNEGTEKQASQ